MEDRTLPSRPSTVRRWLLPAHMGRARGVVSLGVILAIGVAASIPSPKQRQLGPEPALTLPASHAAADLELDIDALSQEFAVVNATAEQRALVDRAVRRYGAAALPLPEFTITFHGDTAGCNGYLGYYDPTLGTLDMCNWGQHYRITPASTLLHELAHAWSFEHMTAEDRQAFTEHRGLDHWHHDGSWWHMGQEQAAEIIAWGVGGTDFASVYIDEAPCSELVAAYTVATGTEPLHQSCG